MQTRFAAVTNSSNKSDLSYLYAESVSDVGSNFLQRLNDRLPERLLNDREPTVNVS
jgi:hypothetical protein